MALTPSIFITHLLLLSLLILASAIDHSYISNPDTKISNPESHGYNPKPKSEDKPNSNGSGSKLNASKSNPEDHGYTPKPKPEEIEHPLPISIEGIVLCKSGLKYYPLQGAVVRITCLAVDEHGHWKNSINIRSEKTDAKGYFLTNLSPSEFTDTLKLKECKAFMENSASQTCKIPLDVDHYFWGSSSNFFSYSP